MHRFYVLSVLAVLAAATAATASSRHGAPHASSQAEQRPSLYLAILADSVAHTTTTVRRSLATGAPVNYYRDGTNGRPLINAAAFGYLPIVALLLERGAAVNARDAQGSTALLVASQNNVAKYDPIIRLLLAKGADPNIADNSRVTPLDAAAFQGNFAAVMALLASHTDPDTRDSFGRTPIEWASYNGYPQIVELLRSHGARIDPKCGLPAVEQRQRDEALLHALADTASVNVNRIKTLLSQGADPSARAVLRNYGVPLNFGEITTPLLTCQSASAFALLLTHGADVDGLGGPLLGSDVATTRRLFALEAHKHGGHLQRAGERLLAAAQYPTSEFAMLVLRYGAPVDARNRQGKTSIMVTHAEPVLETLLAHGADINARDSNGETPLMQAANQTWGEGSAAACDAPWAEVLLRHGADTNRRDYNGNTALMLLAKQGEYGYYNWGKPIKLARLLLAYGARTGLRNKYGHTALQIAKRTGAVSLARQLRRTER